MMMKKKRILWLKPERLLANIKDKLVNKRKNNHLQILCKFLIKQLIRLLFNQFSKLIKSQFSFQRE